MRPETMILRRAIVPRRFDVLDPMPEGHTPQPDSVIPLTDWLALDGTGTDLTGVGILLHGDDDIAPIQALLGRLPVIAVDFPKFADGRGYSHARRIRAHWGYDGIILAVGDILRDQLVYMHRSGIDGFHLRADQDARACLNAFRLFSEFYQYN